MVSWQVGSHARVADTLGRIPSINVPYNLGSVELVDNIREQLVHEVLLNKG